MGQTEHGGCQDICFQQTGGGDEAVGQFASVPNPTKGDHSPTFAHSMMTKNLLFTVVNALHKRGTLFPVEKD